MHSAETYTSFLAEELRKVLEIDLPNNFERIFLRHISLIGMNNYAELGSLVMLECLEKKAQGKDIDGDELLRIVDRIRHRIVRQARREIPVDMAKNFAMRGIRADINPERTALLRDILSKFLKHLSPLQVFLFNYFFIEGNKDKKQILDSLNISQATLYRRLEDIRKAFRDFMG